MLVEGFEHTKNDKKRLISYMLRMLLMAVISIIPFSLAFFGKITITLEMNIFVTLFLSLAMLFLYEFFNSKHKILGVLTIIAFVFISYFANGDYKILGPLFVFCIYKYKENNNKWLFILSFIVIVLCYSAFSIIQMWGGLTLENIMLYYQHTYPLEEYSILAIPIMLLYNGKKGYNSKMVQYFFYLYYPLHLMLIYIFKYVI